MPDTETIRAFYDGYLAHLDKATNRHHAIFKTLDTLELKNASVLDVGCGTGITSRHLAGKAKEVIAVDVSPVLIDFARQHNAMANLWYAVADITEWESDKKFDFISIVDVFEHIPLERLQAFMASVKRLSHDRTQIYLNIPSWDVLQYLHKYHPGILQIVDNPHKDPVSYFREIGFIPAYHLLYWKQYVEYLFYPEVLMKNVFDNLFQSLKRSNVNG